MALAFCLVIRLLGYQLWSTSCFSPVGSSMAGSEQGDERRHMGEWLRLGRGLPCSWLISSGHFGFFRVDDQFGSPFYSWPAWACYFWRMHGLPSLPFPLFPFCMRNCNCCLQISVGRFLPWGFLWKTDTLLYIHH